MGWCILELIIFIFDVVWLIIQFKTENVTPATCFLLGVTIVFGGIIVRELILDIKQKLNSF